MAGWNGSGTYSRYHDWTTDEAGAVNIDATRMDQEDDTIAAGINACLTKNGENTPTANLPMATYKHTGVGAGTARTHYADVGSTQDSTYHYAATSGTDTYTLTLAPAITAYATGQSFIIKVGNANTGAATININSVGAKSLVKGVSTALVAGDLLANKFYRITYDGTNFQVHDVVTYSESIDIDGGTIDGTVIGGSSRAAVSCTTLDANGNVTLGDAAGDTLTVAPNAVTWSNNPTHSGNHIFSGNVTVSGTLTNNLVPTSVKLTGNQTTTSGTPSNVTGLAFSVSNGVYYHFVFRGGWSSDTGTNGIRLGMTTPTFTAFSASIKITNTNAATTTGEVQGSIATSGDSVTVSTAGAIDTTYPFVIEGYILPSAGGTIQVQFASEDGTNTSRVLQGTFGLLRVIP